MGEDDVTAGRVRRLHGGALGRPGQAPAPSDTHDHSMCLPPAAAAPRPSAPRFLLLLVALSLPFWVAGALTKRQLLPALPVSALMAVCPLLAALLLRYRERGMNAAVALLARAGDVGVPDRRWYVPVLLVMPAVAVVSYGVMRASHRAVPPMELPLRALPTLVVALLAAAVCEEVGWSGYATEAMEERHGLLATGLPLGAAWAAWHVVPLVQAHRSASWIAWWSLDTVALRLLTVWLYDRTRRSIAAASLFHATQNLAWQLFPVRGSHYDPRITGIVLSGVVVIVFVLREPAGASPSEPTVTRGPSIPSNTRGARGTMESPPHAAPIRIPGDDACPT